MLNLNKMIENESSPVETSEHLAGTMKKDEMSMASGVLPVQSSSPCVGAGMEGDGDGHSLRTVHSLLSPIRSCRASHKINCSFDTPPPPHPVALDSFLASFVNGSTCPPRNVPPTPGQDFSLPEQIEEMNEVEAKKLLARILIDNQGLREELRLKDRRIGAYKGQMLAILEWKVREAEKSDNFDKDQCASSVQKLIPDSSQESTESRKETFSEALSQMNMIPQKSMHKLQEIRVVDEVFGMRRSLSFIHDLASSMDLDQEQLKHRFKDGCQLTNQLLIGGIAGWISAMFVKKFGKVALSAAAGGILVLVYTTRKGYVNVNYESIYEEISQICDNVGGNDVFDEVSSGPNVKPVDKDEDDSETEGDCDQQKWLAGNFRHAKTWVTSHSYAVGGFVLSFVYNLI